MNFNVTLMILFLMAFILSGCLFLIRNLLKSRHVEKFKEMQNPDVESNRSFWIGWNMNKYLFKREHRILKDRKLSMLSDFTLGLVITYLFIFFNVFFRMIFEALKI